MRQCWLTSQSNGFRNSCESTHMIRSGRLGTHQYAAFTCVTTLLTTLLALVFISLLLPGQYKMSSHGHHTPICHSVGKVTAKLLLSFLAIASSATASCHPQHHPLALLPPLPGAEPQHSLINEHVFVGLKSIPPSSKYAYRNDIDLTTCGPPWCQRPHDTQET